MVSPTFLKLQLALSCNICEETPECGRWQKFQQSESRSYRESCNMIVLLISLCVLKVRWYYTKSSTMHCNDPSYAKFRGVWGQGKGLKHSLFSFPLDMLPTHHLAGQAEVFGRTCSMICSIINFSPSHPHCGKKGYFFLEE